MSIFWHPHPSASAEIPFASAVVQQQASSDGRYPVLPAAVYSVLSWDDKLHTV